MKTILLTLGIFLLLISNGGRQGVGETLPVEIQISETELQIEEWMINDTLWDVVSFDYSLETEEPLRLECWMLDQNYWN